MGTAYFGYETAIEYWRAVGAGIAPWPTETALRSVSEACNLEKEILAAYPQLGITNRVPLHVLVSGRNRTHRCSRISYHICTQLLPEGSFSRISDCAVISSPALCLLQAAQLTKPDRLLPFLELCMEFLGGYSLCEGVPRGFMQHRPFTDRETLSQFIGQLPPHTRGMLMLSNALDLVQPGAWSPREASSFLMLTLSSKLGGYALPKPSLNHEIELGRNEWCLTDKHSLFLDLYWKDARVAFEYDGGDHLDPWQISEDKARRNLLSAMGYRIVVVEKAHIADARLFDQQINVLARMLDVELEQPSDEIAAARRKLRSYLFNPRHYGASPLTRPIILLPEN